MASDFSFLPSSIGSEGMTANHCAESIKNDSNTVKIVATIVLYKVSMRQSPTCLSMQAQIGLGSCTTRVLIYDNSPLEDLSGLYPGWSYVSDPTNRGLATAYNYALSQAKLLGAEWLLLLDQDSNLPNDFLTNLQSELASCDKDSKIAAVVPLVFSGRRQVSPVRPLLGLDRPYTSTRSATFAWLTAINSASAIRVSFMDFVGGFTNDFSLDYLDHWLFRKIHDTGHSVYVSNTRIEHNLSVANFNQGLEIIRYKQILKAEMTFTNRFLPIYWRPLLVLRLIARSIKHAIFTRDKRMAVQMLRAAWVQAASILI